jgi:hypothetical protein
MAEAHTNRSDLRRALALNALAKPVNVLVPAAVLIASALVGAWWLAIVAVACWLALATHTFFDEREAQRVGERRRSRVRVDAGEFTPLIAGRVKAADRARTSIHDAIAGSALPLDDVAREVDDLVEAITVNAARAQRIHRFLTGEEPAAALEHRIAQERQEPVRAALEAKSRAITRLRQRLDALMSELDRAVLALQTMQAQILAADDRALEERRLVGQVSELRVQVQLVSEGLEEAFAESRSERPA